MLQRETGALLFPFHVSCVALCCAQVWNASNGHLLNKLEPVDENEVTGIISLPEKSKIITVGWNRKILVYYDDNQVSTAFFQVRLKTGGLRIQPVLTTRRPRCL